MLSKDDYVQWSSKIIRYRRIQPNIKLLAKSIMEGPYEYKQVLEPGDDTATPRVLMSNTFTRRYSTPTNNNQRISSNTRSKQIAQPMNINQGPLIWPTIKENGVTRPKKYPELTPSEAILADCDVMATNIILQGLPSEIYALVSNHKAAKQLWERIQLLMQGETLRDFYLRFSLLLNDMTIYNVKLEEFQVNTKFLNTLPPEWSKFVTDVKLVRDLHTMNIDQLHAYLGQHEFHANEVRVLHEHNRDPLALVVNHQMTHDELNTAKIALMANLSHFGSDALAKKAWQLEPKLYDGDVIQTKCAIVISDSEETLLLAKESRSKMLLK
nr:hypothetical protein [Tanacetum cinerariifolium]